MLVFIFVKRIFCAKNTKYEFHYGSLLIKFETVVNYLARSNKICFAAYAINSLRAKSTNMKLFRKNCLKSLQIFFYLVIIYISLCGRNSYFKFFFPKSVLEVIGTQFGEVCNVFTLPQLIKNII